ncbi:MAG: hypothetical protein COA52_16465 [Hyphomicrobiales bacterium]|nr:hypothetical protein [Hyphomicrobiales bacterium]PCJ85194.1 MAG: hypothetical protein COA52_16465 [Hyphomicrobiales bacterium]
MSTSDPMIWLAAYGLFYTLVVFYWARVSARANGNYESFFSAGHDLAPWISAVLLAGASVSGWFLLGGAAQIAQHGFTLPSLLQGGIVLALPGVIFFKRIWFVGQRFRLSSQPELFRMYYQSPFLVVVSCGIAVLFAIGFAGMQMRVISQMVSELSGGQISQLLASWIMGLVLFSYVVIGGMRAVGFIGIIQTAMLSAATLAAAVFVLVSNGGIGALNAGLETLAAAPGMAGKFEVAGVIQFTQGLGRGEASGHFGTAVMSLSLAFALMGFQASPLASKIILSTRNAGGIAAGQTWVLAGFFGALIALFIAAIGAAGMLDAKYTFPMILDGMSHSSPWFMAWIFLGAVAGVQLIAGLALLVAAEGLVRSIYKQYFHSSLSRKDTVTLTRIVIGLLALTSMLMQNLTPVTLSALGALALPMAFQLWTPLLGLTWLRWITRPAAIAGVGFGLFAVFVTEPLGYQILSSFGLELPWGRWPWTIHSAAWGMFFNVLAVLIISAISQRAGFGEEAKECRRFLGQALAIRARSRVQGPIAWSGSFAWLFLAIGPGLVFGNFAFGEAGAEGQHWLLGIPSIWAWAILFWVLGVIMVWFLSYRIEMASPVTIAIDAYQPPLRLKTDQSSAEQKRARAIAVATVLGTALIILIIWSFGEQ